jgi:tRNA/tmRNA/rRNA uracil-C5-methylase (TrmA/RlmC/RlmD family)
MGFFPPGYKKILEIEACPISHKEISKFLPQLKEEAITKIPKKYKRANLTIRCGDDGRLAWGGMGRGSLKMESKDYLWTEQTGLRIHYAMETFFQANLYILPSLIKTIRDLAQFPKDTIFLDLYAGVGLWGLSLAADVSCAILIEDNKTSHTLAKYNIEFHGFKPKRSTP